MARAVVIDLSDEDVEALRHFFYKEVSYARDGLDASIGVPMTDLIIRIASRIV